MMKVIVVAIAINNECVEEAVFYGVVQKERDELASKVVKLEGDLSSCKEEHGKEIEEKDGQIKALTDQGKTDRQTIKELTEKDKALEAAYAPGESERDDLKTLDHAAFIKALDGAEGALAILARETFENTLAQV